MSVINEMLRDLEQRRGVASAAPSPVLQGLRASPGPAPAAARAPSKLIAAAPTLGVFFAMLIGFALIEWRIERAASDPHVAAGAGPSALVMRESLALLRDLPVEPLPPVSVTANPPGATGVEAEVPDVHLVGARLERSERRTRLVLGLSGRTNHRVEQGTDGRMQLLLEGARLTDDPPQLHLGGTLLKSMHVSSDAEGVRIQLEPAAPVHAQSSMRGEGENASLVLTLEPVAAPAQSRGSAASARADQAPAGGIPASNAAGSGTFRRTAAAPDGAQIARKSYRRALELIGAGNDEIAIQALRETIAYDPAHPNARTTLASILLRLGRIDEAGGLIREGRSLAPGHPALAKLEARLLIERGMPERALGVLLESPPALEVDPEHHAMIAALLQRAGDDASAAALFRRLLTLRADRAAWWMGLGISLEREGEAGSALVAYRNAARLGGLGAESLGFMQTRIAALGGEQG